MRLDKSNFTLTLMGIDEKRYDGMFCIKYNDMVLGKDIEVDADVIICDPHNEDGEGICLDDSELKLINQLSKIVTTLLEKKNFKLEKWIINYSYETMSTLTIEYKSNNIFNYIYFNLIEDNTMCKKALALSRTIVKRLLKESKVLKTQ